jgi:long-chain acyl-CoA synthetase
MLRCEEILHTSCAQWGSRPVVIDKRGTTSYTKLSQHADGIAQLLHQNGAQPGSVVGIYLNDASDFLAALFGILLARCVAIPISPLLPEAESTRIVRDTLVEWIVEMSGDNKLSLTKVTPPVHVGIREIFPDAAVIRHTSGTTGLSKGVVLSHRAVVERTEASRLLLNAQTSDVILTALPLAYHFVSSALSFIRAGATIIDCASLSAIEMLQIAQEYKATMIYGSPIQYELLSRVKDDCAVPSLRRAISTSALLPSETARSFHSRFNCRLTQVYGIIEVGLPLWNRDESSEPTMLGTCTSPYESAIVDEQGHPVKPGEVGELTVRGPGLFSGYLCGEGAGAQHPANGWFSTGDLVIEDARGVISFKGRKKTVINSGGNKIFPEEVEDVLRTVPQIKAARVSAEPHPLLGSQVVAEIVITPGAASDIDSWRSLCHAQLSGFKVPQEFRVVEDLPTTGSGKIVRHSTTPTPTIP